MRQSYTISGKKISWYYYLTGGICRPWKIFIKTLSNAVLEKSKWFFLIQEGAKKCVERLFGVVLTRYKVLFTPNELWSVEFMKTVAQAAVVMHNMTVGTRRVFYSRDRVGGLSVDFIDIEEVSKITTKTLNEAEIYEKFEGDTIADDIKVGGFHRDLTKA